MNEKIIIEDEFHRWKVNKVKYLELRKKYENFDDHFYETTSNEISDEEFENMVRDYCEESCDC